MKNRSIFLAGFMGTGKSTVGRLLAKKLGYSFTDLDEELVRQAGCSIPEIFKSEGEQGFRQREKDGLSKLIRPEGIILATGGGAVLDQENRNLLIQNGYLVGLLADEQTIWERIGTDPNRPLLQGKHARQRIHDLLQQRLKVYEALPYCVDTQNMSPEQVVDQILLLLS